MDMIRPPGTGCQAGKGRGVLAKRGKIAYNELRYDPRTGTSTLVYAPGAEPMTTEKGDCAMSRFGFIHDKIEIKFLVLYIMARVASPIDFPTLTELTMCDEGVDYFDFAEAVAELVETGHLTLEEDRYAITDKGRHNGEAWESSLPYSVKHKCNANLARVNGILRRNAQVRTQVIPRKDGSLTARMTLDDEGGNIMTIELLCVNEDQAARLSQGFQAKPERVYNEVLAAILDKNEESKDEE